MTSNVRAHLQCEQLLSIIKTSNLNYLVKETPYSAFVTIRKRFVKDKQDNSIVTLAPEENLRDPSLKTENFILKQRCKALECELGNLKKDKANSEFAVQKLSKENESLDEKFKELHDKFESTEKSLYESQENVNGLNEQLDEIENKKQFLHVLLSQTKAKVNEIEKVKKEDDDNIKLLEEIVKNKDFEIAKLKTELDSNRSEETPIFHSCDQCDFTTESEKGLKIHLGKMHEVTCTSCGEKFAGEAKLKTHMCKIHIENPNSEYLYMKNWVVKDNCIQVYGHKEKKEIALLHCKHCTDESFCYEFPSGLTNRSKQVDEEGLIHLKASLYLQSTNIDWALMVNHIYGAGPDDL